MAPYPHSRLDDPLSEARAHTQALLANRDRHLSLPQVFYNDARVFALEMQAIFAQEWLFVGMTCELPTKGSVMTVDIGDNPIMLVRGDAGRIHGYHNVCRHRGSRLCLKDKAKVAKLVCPYHQWTYELDGRLLFAGSDMGDGFDLSRHGLKPIHVRTAGGFIFACLADTPPAIDDMVDTFDHYLEPHGMDEVKVAAESTITERANWKLVIENNRECYHCNGAHPELLGTLQEFDDTDDPRATPAYREQVARKQREWDAQGVPWQLVNCGKRNRFTRTPLHEGSVSMTSDGRPGCLKPMGRLTDYDTGSLRILHLPNSWNHVMGDHAVVFRILPIGPQETQVTTKWLVHKDAVEGVDYHPSRLRYVWDATNDQDRRLAEENQRGINSMAYEPGPYSPTFEFGIIDFLDWYSARMRDNTSSAEPAQDMLETALSE